MAEFICTQTLYIAFALFALRQATKPELKELVAVVVWGAFGSNLKVVVYVSAMVTVHAKKAQIFHISQLRRLCGQLSYRVRCRTPTLLPEHEPHLTQ